MNLEVNLVLLDHHPVYFSHLGGIDKGNIRIGEWNLHIFDLLASYS